MNDQTVGKEEMPFGLWKNDVAIESLMEQASPPAYPFKNKGELYWLEAREKGRMALMQGPSSAPSAQSVKPICITPENFNIRTAVHEYGGRCFCIVDDSIIFNNYQDGNLYRQIIVPDKIGTPAIHGGRLPRTQDAQERPLTSPPLPPPQRLSCNPGPHHGCGYADLVAVGRFRAPAKSALPPSMAVGDGGFIIGIMETAEDNGLHCNRIVALPLGAISPGVESEGVQIIPSAPIILAQGADFYANPVVSSDGKKIAWFEWSHPNMPWDQSRLVTAELKIARQCDFRC